MITLYDFELSGNCYKLRLLMGILGVEYQTVAVDFYPGHEQKSDWFARINPLRQLPVLDDDGFVLRDSQAILTYLAANYDPAGTWYPRAESQLLGEIAQWLAFADGLTATASAARLHDAFSFDHIDVAAARAGAHRRFRILDEHLWFREQEDLEWICAAREPTIADIACFPNVVLSEEGGVPRQDYPAIRRWCDRIKRIDGFRSMSGVFPAGPGRQAAGSPTETTKRDP